MLLHQSARALQNRSKPDHPAERVPGTVHVTGSQFHRVKLHRLQDRRHLQGAILHVRGQSAGRIGTENRPGQVAME